MSSELGIFPKKTAGTGFPEKAKFGIPEAINPCSGKPASLSRFVFDGKEGQPDQLPQVIS